MLAAYSLTAASCGSNAENNAHTEKQHLISDSTMQLLKIDTVKMKNLDEEVKLSGEISFNENKIVKVYPFSSGQVLTTDVSIGDYVQAGQVLATIKSADIAGNYADLSAAGNDVAIAKRAMDNAKHLYDNGIASEKEYIEAKENYNKALSAEHKIKQEIQINGGGRTNASGIYTVTAPRSGYVVEKLINPGNFIRNDNNSHLFTIGDISDVWVWANVYETDVAKVKQGYDAIVSTLAYTDTVFKGKVNKVSEVLDPVTKVMKIRIDLPNQEGLLKPEMFANIKIYKSETAQAPAVPNTAIINDYGKNYLIIFNSQDDASVKEVTLLKTVGKYTFIKEGVHPGQKVITQNQILLFRKLREK